jgi:hypothetical protein
VYTTVQIQSTKEWIPPVETLGSSDPAQTSKYWQDQVYVMARPNQDTVVHCVANKVVNQNGTGHAFYNMVNLAFANHGSMVLTPDDVFTCISQQFSKYVKKNSELLRDLFVEHKDKLKLEIKMDPVNYEVFTDQIVDAITQHTKGDVTNLLAGNFSTSTKFDDTLNCLGIMSTMKNYFAYSIRECCGLPQIHFTGTVQDWEQLRAKTRLLTTRYHRGNKNPIL